MDILEAADARISCRAYTDREVEPEKLAQIQQLIDQYNKEADLHFQLYGPEQPGQPAVKMNEKMFHGPVMYYIACAAADTPLAKEKVGYYGEKIILLATQLGLGTCWVASTYDMENTRFELAEGEGQHCIITLGYAPEKMPLKQRTIRAAIRAKDKKLKELVDGDLEAMPEWFVDGVKCVLRGPTAINQQPVVFGWDGESVTADMPAQKRGIQDVDLGICKYHFEIGCGKQGAWEWGKGGKFKLA